MPKNINSNADIKRAMIILSKQEALNKNDVLQLADGEWCAKNLRLNFPMLRCVEEGRLDERRYIRYWREEINIHEKKYYICSQWYPHNRIFFEEWLKRKIK